MNVFPKFSQPEALSWQGSQSNCENRNARTGPSLQTCSSGDKNRNTGGTPDPHSLFYMMTQRTFWPRGPKWSGLSSHRFVWVRKVSRAKTLLQWVPGKLTGLRDGGQHAGVCWGSWGGGSAPGKGRAEGGGGSGAGVQSQQTEAGWPQRGKWEGPYIHPSSSSPVSQVSGVVLGRGLTTQARLWAAP